MIRLFGHLKKDLIKCTSSLQSLNIQNDGHFSENNWVSTTCLFVILYLVLLECNVDSLWRIKSRALESN